MARNKHVVQVTLKPVDAAELKATAERDGNTVAGLGRVLITKGLKAHNVGPLSAEEEAKAVNLYQNGVCPTLDEAMKVVGLLRGSI